jgi:hypothetical protein
MSRICRDCGVADWQPCVCTDEHARRERAAEEFADPPADAPAFDPERFASRIVIQHAIGRAAHEQLHGNDLLAHLDEHERVGHLSARLGDVATEVLDNHCLDLDDALVRLGAHVQLWLEQRARDAAA